MNAVIYCRVSTKEQAQAGYSLETQEKVCRAYAERTGYSVSRCFIGRGESAKTISRTQLKKLLNYVFDRKNKIDAVIVFKLDRLCRNMVDYTDLVSGFSKIGDEVKSATENLDESPTGRLMKNIIASFAQFENDVRSERTLGGMKQAVLQGRWCWRAPIGYRNTSNSENKPTLVPTEESRFIKEAFRLAGSGLNRQIDIAENLRSKGFRITNQQIHKMLRNPLYCGLIKTDWHPDYIDAVHEPIISKQEFFRVQAVLDGRRPRVGPKLRNHPDFPLRNFVVCANCGRRLTGSWSTGRRKVKYPYYHCPTKGCSMNVRREILDTEFINYLESIQPESDILDLFEAVVMDVWKTKQASRIAEKRRVEKDLKSLEERRDRIDELIIEGVFGEETYQAHSERIQEEIVMRRLELDEADTELNDIEACLSYCKFFLSNCAALWEQAELNLKQRFQNLIFPEGIAFDGMSFGTARPAFIFKQLQPQTAQKCELVAPRGFEPRSDG